MTPAPPKKEVCVCCHDDPCSCRVIAVPVHPDDKDVPLSIVYYPISKGRYVRLTFPLAAKTMDVLHNVLLACKPVLVTEEKPQEDFEI